MEHEIYVPFSATVLRAALADAECVARCVPGLHREPGDDPAAFEGRLRLRIGSSTITYRGTLTLGERGEGITVDGDGKEARGNGSARSQLTIVPRPVADGSGTTLSFSGQVEATGRITEFSARQQHTAGRRLLDRFTEALIAELSATEPAAFGRPDDDEPVIPGIPAPDSGGEDAVPGAGTSEAAGAEPGETAPAQDDRGDGPAPDVLPPHTEPGDTPVADAAEPAGDPETAGPGGAVTGAASLADGPGGGPGAHADEPVGKQPGGAPGAPPDGTPEADLARRTMIGRSAEEVDHAPPRGRYAPREVPGAGAGVRTPLHWAAPAAVLAVAGVVAVTRALRRRR